MIIPVKAATPQAPIVNAFWSGGVLVVTTRTPDGSSEERKVPAELVGFMRLAEVDEELARLIRSSGAITSQKVEGEWLRLRFRQPDDRYRFFRFLEDKLPGVGFFEGDVSPVVRYLADSGAQIAKPRRVFTDIETDSRAGIAKALLGEARILSWAMTDDDDDPDDDFAGIVGMLEEDSDAAERELLLDFWHEAARYEQIIGWNLDRFDKLVLIARSKKLIGKFEPRRWLWVDHLPIFKRGNISASKSGDEKQSMALENVARAVLKEGKLEGFDTSKTFEAWRDDRPRLARYNLRDAKLEQRIERKTGYLALHQTVCEVCGVLPDTKGAQPGRFIDSYMLRRGRSKGMRWPTKFIGDEKAQQAEREHDAFLGAYVMPPTVIGLVRDVHVFDFKSLYPSIIMSWNISPETWARDISLEPAPQPSYLRHLPPSPRKPLPPGHCVTPDGIVYRTDVRGMFAEMCDEFVRERAQWQKAKSAAAPGSPEWDEADRRSTSSKQVPNAGFGVLGLTVSRYHEEPVAQSITQTGAHLIKVTLKAAPDRVGSGIYGDTDSGFVQGGSDDAMRAFVKWANDELYPPMLKEMGCSENRIKLAYEKKFSLLVLISKKRYAGRFAHYDGTPWTERSKPEIKGLEFKRGDTTRLARQLQAEVLDMMLGGGVTGELSRPLGSCVLEVEPYVELVRGWRRRVLEDELARDDVVLSKSLSKEIDAYVVKKKKDGEDAAQPVHVTVAKELRKRGLDVGEGERISYVVIDASDGIKAIPAQDFDGTCDRHYLWENLIYPATQRVLEAAFKMGPWETFERSRPPKPRGSAAKRARAEESGQRRLF